MAGKTLFNSPYVSDYVYDDFRAYTGVLTALHVQSIYELGREVRSANLAEAKPQSRRTFCVIAKYGGVQSAYTPCATGLFYNGLVIDLLTSIETTGVVFQFRDTALDEIGYEVLRRESGSTSSYDVVLFIDSGMSGCSYTYNMLSFYDADAAKEPGVTWEYAIRTKYDASTHSDFISDAYTYVVPWYGTVDGTVVAGDTEVPVADVRVCARLDSSTTSDTDLLELGSKVTSSASSYMAKNRYVTHSAETLSAFEATDGETDTSVTVDHGEHLKVNLDVFASVSKVTVSFKRSIPPKYDHCMYPVDGRRALSDYTGITCNGATSMTTSSNDPTECFQTCSECSTCVSFSYHTSNGVCTWASSGSWNDGSGDSSYEWYRSCASSGSTHAITTSNFATHVAGCLEEAPIDGLCKEYSGKSFSGYTDNYIGMMPYWDVSAVTNMSEAFKDKDTFNADLSSWDVSSVTNMNDMFNGASSFNQDISGWNVDSSAVTTTSMFSGATAFQERFTCTSLLDGPPNSECIDWSSMVVRVLDFDDPDDNGDRGLRCISASFTSTGTDAYEQTYSCVGTYVTAFPGQHVTILNDLGSSVSIFEIEVTGDELACPYYGFSDDDGNFEIEIHEATGVSQKKTKVAVRAFKTDVFDPEDVSVFTPMEEGSNDSVTIKSPEAVLIALEYDDTSSSSGSSSLATAAELGASTGTDCDYSKTSNKKKTGVKHQHALIQAIST